jgi:hypothetical protein
VNRDLMANARVAAEDEPLRFLLSFHDVFLTVGIFILNVGLGILIGTLIEAMGMTLNEGLGWLPASFGFALFAGLQLLLATYFTARKRRLLPSILICLSFVFGAFLAFGLAFGGTSLDGEALSRVEDAPGFFAYAGSTSSIVVGFAAFAAFVFYAVFRLPFAMGLTAAIGAGALTLLVGTLAPDALSEAGALVAFALGLFIFLLGVWFDMRDPDRQTRFSDNGFWLHLVAAPLMLNGALSMIAEENAYGDLSAVQASTILAILAAFAFLSILINRRALVVSGLVSAGIAIFTLIRGTGIDGAPLAALTLVLLGGLVVWLGAGWHSVRAVVIAPFPKDGLVARIVPPITADG